MEKPGMAWPIDRSSGLLTRFGVACIALVVGIAAAAEAGPTEPLAVIVQTFPDVPRVGEPFVLTVLVDHPEPAELSVAPPPFPEGLSVERTRVELSFQSGPGEALERWTAVEFTVAVRSAGDFAIGSFRARAGSRYGESAPFTLRMVAPIAADPEPRLFWTDVPSRFTVGEAVPLRLAADVLVGSAEPALAYEVPENAIFERVPTTDADRRTGTVALFRITAVAPGFISIPEVRLAQPGGPELVARGISDRPATARRGDSAPTTARLTGPAVAMIVDPATEARVVPANPIPDRVKVFPFLTVAPNAELRAAAERWAAGDVPTALHALRRAERDSWFGFALRPIRRSAESAAGLSPAHDELYAPESVLGLFAVIAAAFSVVSLFVAWIRRLLLRKSGVTLNARRRFTGAVIAAVLACAAAGYSWYARSIGATGAVLAACDSYRVPETTAARSASFAAGQAVRIRVSAGSWHFVECADGRSGWIEARYASRY